MADKSLHDILRDAAKVAYAKSKDKVDQAASRIPVFGENTTPDNGINEKQRSITEYRNVYGNEAEATPPAKKPAMPTIALPVDPHEQVGRKYGDRPGEKLIDTREMLKPLGSALPSYTDGGDVLEDETARVHANEKVLNPEEAAQYRAEHGQDHLEPTHETEGAPADFPGRVLPNPNNIRAMDDQDAQMRVDTPRDANFTLASQKDSKGMKAAQQQAENPGAQTTQPVRVSEEVTPNAQNAADRIGQGDFIGAGREALVDKLKAPKEFSPHYGFAPIMPSSDDASSVATPFNVDSLSTPIKRSAGPGPVGLPPISGTADTTPAPQPKLSLKEQREKLKQERYAALAERTPEGKVRADYIKDQLDQLNADNPWGSQNNHNNIAGKLAHIFARAGNVAGDVLAPGLMMAIPGTELNRGLEQRIHQGEENEDVANLAATNKLTKDGTPAQQYIKTANDLASAQAAGDTVKAAALQKRLDVIKQVMSKSGAHGQQEYVDQFYQEHSDLPRNTATLKQALQEYSSITAKPIMMEVDNGDGTSRVVPIYPNETVASSAQKPGAKAAQEAGLAKHLQGRVLVFNTPHGRIGRTYAQAQAEGLDVNDASTFTGPEAEKLQSKNDAYEVAKNSLAHYKQDILNGAALTPQDEDALETIVSHVETTPDYIAKIAADIYDAVSGKPISGGTEKLAKEQLTKKQFDALSPQGLARLSDYYHLLLAHFNSVKETQGSIPRNPVMIKVDMNAIPLPYLEPKEAQTAFNRYEERLQELNHNNVSFRPTPDKAAAAEGKMPDGSTPAQIAHGANGEAIGWSGKPGDPWIDLNTGKPWAAR